MQAFFEYFQALPGQRRLIGYTVYGDHYYAGPGQWGHLTSWPAGVLAWLAGRLARWLAGCFPGWLARLLMGWLDVGPLAAC
jgi:hypothetical protein